MDSLRSIIRDSGDQWKNRDVRLQLTGEITIICEALPAEGDPCVTSERSTLVFERSGDEVSQYEPSIVSLPPDRVSSILRIIFDTFTGGSRGEEDKG